MQQPRPVRPGLAALSLFLALAAAVPAAAAPSLALVAPESLRQGDPLLVWIVEVDAPTDLRPAAADAAPGGGTAADTGSPSASAAPAQPDAASAPGSAPPAADEPASAVAASSAATAVAPPAPSRPTLRLLGPDGAIAAETSSFGLPSLLEPGDPSGRAFRVSGALVGLPTDLAPGSYTIVAASADGSEAGAVLSVAAREFPVELIELNEANTAIRARPTKRQVAEAKKLFALLAKIDGAAVYADFAPFQFPVKGGFKSAGFGDRRRYLYAGGGAEDSVHAGLDWGVVKGTAVSACERGKVVMAADRELTGKTLVVEHLPGLYSLYFHLSAIKARPGSFVERGQVVALSGSTGLSTGPHLHWELRALGRPVDPEYWLSTPLLDKDAIKATIYGLIEGR
jgi:murein DD-endopeptidase MepM/ murein hydrolase activator NlpD